MTATASFDVLADVERELTLGGNLTIDSETIVRPESDSRPELTYRIIEVFSNFDELREPNEQFLLKAKSDWELKDVVATAKKNKMYELLHEIPSDIVQVNQHGCDILMIKQLLFIEKRKQQRWEPDFTHGPKIQLI